MPQDALSPDLITANLGTSFIGQRVLHYPRLTSTMDMARQQARQRAAEGTVVIAEEQLAGRGRIKRPWLSPGGNIALSVVLYPDLASLPYLIMLASAAVASTIEAVTGLKTGLKWPNDVLINGKKVCGILVESEVRGGIVFYAVIGIGINVNLDTSGFPEIASTATSLLEESGKNVSRLAVVRRLLVEIERRYAVLPDGQAIYDEWRERLITLGKRVGVKSGESTLEGIAEAVDKDGSLQLRHSDGSLTRIIAGDVTLRESE